MQKESELTDRITMNSDNSDLGPVEGGCVTIGYVDQVNGPCALEVPTFVPTRAELLQLIRYWEDIYLDYAFFTFRTGRCGSDHQRLIHFAQRRVNRITGLLGDEAAKVVQEVREQFALRVDLDEWKAFCAR